VRGRPTGAVGAAPSMSALAEAVARELAVRDGSLEGRARLTGPIRRFSIFAERGLWISDPHGASAVARFASDIGARVVAEGIESRAELLALRALGIRLGQGYHLARPAPLPQGRVPTRIELSVAA
jgi:hypothetical protein